MIFFLKECEDNELYSSTFPAIFANKILIENFTEQLLTKHYKCENDRDRTKTFSRILKNYPPFFNLVHDFIKNNTEKCDSTLYGFYFKSLSSNIITKCNINREEVISIIDSYDTNNDENFAPKKLNAYISLEPKDISLYNHIMKNMNESISNNGKVKATWEDAIKNFDKQSQEQYENKNISLSPLTEEEGYYYMFKLNTQYVVEKTRVHEARADRFNRALHQSVSDLVKSEFKSLKEFKYTSSVEFTFSSIEDKNEVKNFCNFFIKDINSLISQIDFIKSVEDHKKLCNSFLEKAYLAYCLNNQLSSGIKKINNKIKI
jgi:hypothetical protein